MGEGEKFTPPDVRRERTQHDASLLDKGSDYKENENLDVPENLQNELRREMEAEQTAVNLVNSFSPEEFKALYYLLDGIRRSTAIREKLEEDLKFQQDEEKKNLLIAMSKFSNAEEVIRRGWQGMEPPKSPEELEKYKV